MRVPLSWLRELVPLPEGVTGRTLGDALLRAGLEVETVEEHGRDVTGPLVIGAVLGYEHEKHSNGKTIRWCTVDVGEPEPRGIVCGAHNFAVGDRVVVALPGAVLPGGFGITARRTYGHVSDGMICSARELGLGEDHEGIMVMPSDSVPGVIGADAAAILALRDDVLDIAVTPDRGYALSIRGVAREAATAYDLPFTDPAGLAPAESAGGGWPVRVLDNDGCDGFVALRVTGFDPTAVSPLWLQRRVQRAGMRPISLAVDVTNYVMLELGQPLHAYDAAKLRGAIVVRRAEPGERLRTLDGADRELSAVDLLITDDSGPIGIAGVMGGASTEIGPNTTDIVLEAAHFAPAVIGAAARRHKLPSEASRRFERGVDPGLPEPAARRAAGLLAELGGGVVEAAITRVGGPAPQPPVLLPADLCTRVAGRSMDRAVVLRRLDQVGCTVADPESDVLDVTPPTWRPDLTDPADLVEEVLRLEGYETLPSVLPIAPAGRGLTVTQRLRRRIGRALADAGYVEAPCSPFAGPAALDALGLPPDDPRRLAVCLANPLSEREPDLRTTLLPGLLAALRRNVSRGMPDVALFELGVVFRPQPGQDLRAPRLGVDARPSEEELAAQEAALPAQPERVAVVLAGVREQPGWWGPGRAAEWSDALEAARLIARQAGVDMEVRRDEHAPWHPGRCAVLLLEGEVVGHAGELHPGVIARFGLPARTCAAELALAPLAARAGGIVLAPVVSTFPVATQDVALVVDDTVAAADVEAALREGAGPLLEGLRLFDRYTGDQIGPGRTSLAYALRFRAPDRTLTAEEATRARETAVAEATRRTGAELRGV